MRDQVGHGVETDPNKIDEYLDGKKRLNKEELTELDRELRILLGYGPHDDILIKGNRYTPTINPAQWAELLERFKINLEYCYLKPDCKCDGWIANRSANSTGQTAGIAVVKAVIALLGND